VERGDIVWYLSDSISAYVTRKPAEAAKNSLLHLERVVDGDGRWKEGGRVSKVVNLYNISP
jgi:hypothetical protein